MKLMFASDIHGCADRCEEMLGAYRREGAEKLCLLGDILYHGPRNGVPRGYDPKTTAELLNAVADEIICVRGNCDSEVDQMMLSFPIMADYALIYAEGRTFFLTHGHRFNPGNLPPLRKGDVMINGHTHIFGAAESGGIHCVNGGSVSLPKENNPRSYMIYENGTFFIKDLEGRELLRYSAEG